MLLMRHGGARMQLDGGVAGTSEFLRAEAMQDELSDAVREERYEDAAKLRDQLASLQRDARVSVLQANKAFYHALRTHAFDEMDEMWPADGALAGACTRVYSGFPTLTGRQAIIDVWRQVVSDSRMALSTPPDDFRCVVLRGGLSAVVTCVERSIRGGPGDSALATTNVWEREVHNGVGATGPATVADAGPWRLVLHQARPLELVDANAGMDEEPISYDDPSYPGVTG